MPVNWKVRETSIRKHNGREGHLLNPTRKRLVTRMKNDKNHFHWHPDSTLPSSSFLFSISYSIITKFHEQRIPPSLTWAWSLSPRASVANTVQGISPSLPAVIYQAKSTAGTPEPGPSLFKALIRDTVTGKKRGRDTWSDI